MTFALVLGGGGTSGLAWETGLLKGLRDSGLNLASADLIVGTSAGAILGAQLATGCDLEDLYERQLQPPAGSVSIPDLTRFREAMTRIAQSGGLTQGGLSQAARAQLGAMAVEAEVGSEETRLAAMESYLPVRSWPAQRLLITAVDTADGEFVVWNKDSGVPLLQAVASSCALPMVRPAITINGRRYMDGGTRSGTSADLAAGYELVVVVAVLPLSPDESTKPVGSRAELLMPDGPSRQAIFPNPLDLSRRASCAQAGFAQGIELAPTLSHALKSFLS